VTLRPSTGPPVNQRPPALGIRPPPGGRIIGEAVASRCDTRLRLAHDTLRKGRQAGVDQSFFLLIPGMRGITTRHFFFFASGLAAGV